MNSCLPRVVIVLSTFNGEQYLKEQIDSLISQTYKNIAIIVRDDGSSDKTCEILEQYAEIYEDISVKADRNIGVVDSFLQLLALVPSNADFVALCDQDDVWGDEKIERAVAVLGNMDPNRPAVYCSALEVVDENLNHIRIEQLPKRGPELANALVQNVASGCTAMINLAALQLVTRRQVCSSKILMHDWWLYQVVSAFGTVVYDNTPAIKYRQHRSNVIGSSSGARLWIDRIKRQLGPNGKFIRLQAKELLRAYGSDMCSKDRLLISEFLERTAESSLGRRLVYALRTPVYRQSWIDNLALRTLIAFSRI